MVNESECFLHWAIPTWESWAESEHAERRTDLSISVRVFSFFRVFRVSFSDQREAVVINARRLFCAPCH